MPAPLGLSLVILGGYWSYKIYEFFFSPKPKKDCLLNSEDLNLLSEQIKLHKQKISKEAIFPVEQTLRKL